YFGHQKFNFNANWITRGPALVDVIRPNVEGTAMLLFGFAKLAQLKMLKNSVRNSPRTLSVIGLKLGLFGVPRFVPATIGREITNAEVLKKAFSRSCVLPLVSILPVNPDAKLAR